MDIFKLHTSDLDKIVENLKQFHLKFISDFRTKTRSVEQQSLQYLQGILLEQGRSNMVKYGKKVPNTENLALQHFISNSPWDEKPVIKKIHNLLTSYCIVVQILYCVFLSEIRIE